MTTREQPIGRELSSVTKQLVRDLDDVLWAIYQAVDEAQRRTVDASLDVATLRAFTPARLRAAVAMATDQCADAFRVFGSLRGVELGYRELLNKLEVLELVRYARRFVGAGAASENDLPQLVDAAYSLPAFRRIWVIEGLGHDYADWAYVHTGTARLLTAEGAVPGQALLMLHAGLGLSAADRLLRMLTPFDGDAALRTAVEQFRALCDRSALRGYAGCAYESLGLVTRTLHFPLVGAIDRALAAAEPPLRPYFWHGVGRALYFSPLHFVPGVATPWASLDDEPPDELARLNATAGLAWATALVNMRHPEIVAALWPYVTGTAGRDDAVASGVTSTCAMALETDPSNPYVPQFCAYVPADAEARRSWSAAVPSLDAVDAARLAAREGPGLDSLFMYSPVRRDLKARGGR